MDGAFLVHRGLILPDDDAFEQIPELLAEEALVVMTDNHVGADNAKALAEEAIDSYGIEASWKAKGKAETADGELAVKMLKGGPDTITKGFDLNGAALNQLHAELDWDGASAKARSLSSRARSRPWNGSRN